MARKILATIMVLLGVSAAALYLFYTPANLALTITDPPPQPYDNSITAIYIIFTTVDIHAADAGSDSGWHTLVTGGAVNLLAILDTSKTLGNTQLPPGRYTEIRFFASQATITINGTNQTYTIPSGGQTGVKVAIAGGGFRIFGGQRLTIQLDLAFNNNEIMNNPGMKLTPVATARVV